MPTRIPFEPSAVRLQPDGQRWLDFFIRLHDLYRQSAIEPALKRLREGATAASDRQAMARAPTNEFPLANATYWLEHERCQYPAVELDLGAFEAHIDRMVLMVRRESRGYPAYEVNVELGKKLGRDVIELSGGQIGFVIQPAEFERDLVEAPSRSGHGPKTGYLPRYRLLCSRSICLRVNS